MACHSTPSKKRRATLDHARDVMDTATQLPLLPSRNKDVNHVPGLHHKLACIAFVSCDISLPCFFWNKLNEVLHVSSDGREKGVCGALFFAGGGGSPQCGSALRQGLHVPPLKKHSGWVWAGKTKRRRCALDPYASSAHGTRDMHDAYSTSLPKATAHVTSHLTVMYLYAGRGERGVCGGLFFYRLWWKPAERECAPPRAACPPRVHHRSPGVLAVYPALHSGCAQPSTAICHGPAKCEPTHMAE